jgi:uncharacterized protein YneF (UPF0154 family)
MSEINKTHAVVAASMLVLSIPAVIIAGVGFGAESTARWSITSAFSPNPPLADDQVRFLITVGPFVPFFALIAAVLKSERIGVFTLGIFVAWSGLALTLLRLVDAAVNHNGFFTSDDENDGKMLEGGEITLLFLALFSLISVG